jgi:hypothetical protein
MNSIKHNKIKNTGILFELLTRQITNDVLEGKNSSIAEEIMQRHFNPRTDLGRELMLYRSFFNIDQLSENKAFQFIGLISKQREKLDEKTLGSQKYNLIKDIKEHYDLKEFSNIRIPSYKIYASIYKLFEVDTEALFEVEDVATTQFTLVEHLMGKTDTQEVKREVAIMEAVRSQDQTSRILTYKVLLEKFNEKYAHLSDKQKKLLREYIYNISTSNKLHKFINEEAKNIRSELESVLGKVDNTVTQIKLREVISQLEKMMGITIIKENHITSMLFAYEILDELNQLGKSHGR